MEVSSRSVSAKRILFATDFSDRSSAALPYALSLSRKPGGRLVIAHIVSLGPFGVGLPSHEGRMATAQGVREAQVDMQQLEQRLDGVAHQTVVRSGEIVAEMNALVEREAIDVLVLGTHGRTGISKAIFGSVAEKLFRHVRRPVMTIGPHVTAEPGLVEDLHSILYPTDFSEESQGALAYATVLAQDYGARLYLLHVADGAVGRERHDLEKKLYDFVGKQAHFSCEPRARVENGAAGQIVVDVAEELAVDLIVMGPKRRSGIPGTMATTYEVVSRASCPVLTVRG